MSPRVYLIVPALAAFVIDVALTLWGQPREYWNGDYGVAQEMAPVGFALLAHHPLAFVLAARLGDGDPTVRRAAVAAHQIRR